MACSHRSDVCRETNTQKVDVVQYSFPVPQSENIAFSRAACDKRFHRVFHAFVAEFPKERISCSKWKKSKRRAFRAGSVRKQSVHNFKRGSISANRNKFPIAIGPCLAHHFRGMAGSIRLANINFNARSPQLVERWRKELPYTSSACRWVRNRQKFIQLAQSSLIAERSSVLPISCARSLRLIFKETVRGKSFCHSR